MKQQVLMIHGGEAFSNNEDWINFLKSVEIEPFKESQKKWKHTLAEDLGINWEVFMPQMPNSFNAKYEEWLIWFEKYIPYLRDEVVLVGHSLGAMFLARYLSENVFPVKVSKLFLMAGAFTRDANVEGGGKCEYFYAHLDNFDRLNQSADQVYIVHSKDDPVVPYEHAELFMEKLPDARLVQFENYGHFAIEEFTELVELIKK